MKAWFVILIIAFSGFTLSMALAMNLMAARFKRSFRKEQGILSLMFILLMLLLVKII